jgi:hypothetical protein
MGLDMGGMTAGPRDSGAGAPRLDGQEMEGVKMGEEGKR